MLLSILVIGLVCTFYTAIVSYDRCFYHCKILEVSIKYDIFLN